MRLIGKTFILIANIAVVLGIEAPLNSFAQANYPSRTVKIIVPLPAGAAADVLPRVLADKLTIRWGQPVIIENRPGAGLKLGAEAVAKAAPDGYTLLATPSTPLTISQSLDPNLHFNPQAFVPISIFAETAYVLVVNPKVPVSTLSELIAFAKAKPDQINFASPGIGTGPHLTGEMLKLSASIQINHIPYKGLAPAMTDLLAGHVDMMFDNIGNTLALIKEGKLKALGVANKTRLEELPDVPAIAETFPGFYSTAWFGMVAPPTTAPHIASLISRDIAETLRLADVVKRFRDFSIKPLGTTLVDTAKFIKEDTERWRNVIAASGIKVR
jgi:tripartite-type tricarboxylate transporter receptor subunit TctC